jgi:hypothetical protein
MHREHGACASLNLFLMCGKFEIKLEILYGKMTLEMIDILEFFLAFLVTFNIIITHNMCALQLDPRFKGL